MPEPNLQQLQQWMQSLLLAQGPLPARLQAEAKRAQTLVAGGGPAPVARRLQVYAAGYRMRLLECLSADFPALEQFLGKALFERFGNAFLDLHPSRSFTLFNLGAEFANYLNDTRPPGSTGFYALPAALARVERARNEALRAAGPEDAAPADWTPARLLLEGPALRRPECCRLLELPFALKDFYEALLHGEAPELPAEEPAWLALSRAQYRLTITVLTETEYRLLAACAEPQPFYRLAAQLGMPAAALLPLVLQLATQGLLLANES